MSGYVHAVAFVSQRCVGCMDCMRVCPTEAIRVRGGRASHLEGRCIDCGLCLQACSHGAIESRTSPFEDLDRYEHRVAIPSPSLYGQFGPDIPPVLVREALTSIGFHDVYDLEQAGREVTMAVEGHLAAHPRPRPMISNWCPVVVRMIQVRFPELVDHVIPIRPPRDLAAQQMKESKGIEDPHDRSVGAIYLTPCPAKMIAILQPAERLPSWLDAATGIDQLYNPLMREIQRLQRAEWEPPEETALHSRGRSSLLGVAPLEQIWLRTQNGALLRSRITGIQNVIKALEEMVDGGLTRYDLLDCFSCRTGCSAGPQCVASSYNCSANLEGLGKVRGEELWPVDAGKVRRRLGEGYYDQGASLEPRPVGALSSQIGRAAKLVLDWQRLLARLPSVNCGLCGVPSCETFAEDCVRGVADPSDCVFLHPAQVEELAVIYRSETREDEVTLESLALALELEAVTPDEISLSVPVTGAYTSDLLSDVMGNALEGQLWITLQCHVNIVAVATLRSLAGIILVGGRSPQPEALERATEEGVPILRTDLTAFELAGRLYQIGLRGGEE